MPTIHYSSASTERCSYPFSAVADQRAGRGVTGSGIRQANIPGVSVNNFQGVELLIKAACNGQYRSYTPPCRRVVIVKLHRVTPSYIQVERHTKHKVLWFLQYIGLTKSPYYKGYQRTYLKNEYNIQNDWLFIDDSIRCWTIQVTMSKQVLSGLQGTWCVIWAERHESVGTGDSDADVLDHCRVWVDANGCKMSRILLCPESWG